MARKTARAPRRTAGGAARNAPRRTVTGYYVPSTHWDREWYESFQQYRFRLVDVIDAACDLLERDPEYRHYQLDGQSVVLEDYLEIRPEQRDRLARLYAAGRLTAGPWYVLPDEFLVSGESLVRNLLRGHQVAGEFGPPMPVGFVCDIFGHNSQLPQILRGFGLDTAVVWRGTNFPRHPGLFRWQSPDGSEVLTYAFEDWGYGQYQVNVRDPARTPDGRLDLKKALAGLRRVYEIETPRVPGNAILLFDGVDHVPPEPATTTLLRKARQAGLPSVHATLAEFFAAVRRQKLKLPVFRGELREPGIRGGHLIPGVLSSRVYLKQYNARCEGQLTLWAEPWGAWAALLGHEYPAAYLRLAWKYLLRNHPHDSICGCSIDQVHRDMLYRFDQCYLIAERAGHLSRRALADAMRRPALARPDDYHVTVFNPTARDLDEVVDLALYFPRDTPHRFNEWFGYEPIIGFRLADADGRDVPYQRLAVNKVVPFKTYDPAAGYIGDKREEVRVAARLRIPPYGWTTLTVRPTSERTRSAGSQLVDDHTMENEHLRVTINPNGTLDVLHRATGTTYRNGLTFEDRADIGDGWYHGTAVNDETYSSAAARADIALVHDGFARTTFRVRVELLVPEAFQHDRDVMKRSPRLAPLVITSELTLRAGAPWLEIRTVVANTIRDHRLRVLFPSHLPVDTYFADSPFDVVERPIRLHPESHTWMEPEVETKPQHSFTAVNDGRRGLALISTGQPESAVRDLPDRPLALTLLRGFTRTVSHEGETDGQMLGPSTHTYWLYPHAGPLPVVDLFHLGQYLAGGLACIYTDAARARLLAGQTPRLPAHGSWLRPGPGPLVVTACKQADDGGAVILRLFNPTGAAAQQRFEFATPVRAAWRANLLEQPGDRLTARGSAVTISAGPREIVTVRLELAALVPPSAANGARPRTVRRTQTPP